jgi:peptide deformylase
MPVDPSSLAVVHDPDPILRRKAATIVLTDEVRAVARAMIELMKDEEGIGLAAPQVGLAWRLFVAHVPPGEGRKPADDPATCQASPMVYINPVLSAPEGPVEPFEEGCLSLPDIRGTVFRPPVITITATDLEGTKFTHRAGGLLARCWQHEIDHLDGVQIIDKMPPAFRMRAKPILKELEEDYESRGRSFF